MGLLDGVGGAGAAQETEITSWPSKPLNVNIDGLDIPLKPLDNIGYVRGYTKNAFIQQCALQLFSATNFDDKNPTVEANRCVQYAKILAQVLGL